MSEAAPLEQKIKELEAQLEEKEMLLKSRASRISTLEELIKQFQRKQFSASSEKLSKDQLDLGLFNEAESTELNEASESSGAEPEDTIEVPSHTRRKQPQVSLPANLPREEVLYELPETERVCPHDGTELKAIGTEDHEQLDIIPAQAKVIVHRRQKYVCPCCEKHHVTATKPKQPIEKSIASAGLLAYVATQKYCDALPLYRQSEIFKRAGLALGRTNLANWMIRSGQLVQPLINLLQDKLLVQPVIHLDETTVQVLNEPGKTAESQSYMWVMGSFAASPTVLFHYADSRRQSVPLDLLDESVSTIMVDGYEGYEKACKDYRITRLGCWAHARRKLMDAKTVQKKGKAGKADQGLAFIQKLYALEKSIKDQPPDERYRRRQQEAKPIIDKLRAWLEKSLPHVPPQSAIGRALLYLHNQWDRLVRYLDDGAYPIDNNRAENAIRPFTVGRKNWLFSNSQAGAKASANLYSLIETAKANGVNPYDYLKIVFKELPNAQSVESVEALLPWNASKTLDHV
ncbi:IS66 family transposase [Gilvimarinus agarilyticus]|uniref:IS66 family transposase n=1 Tax=Gilvimarinus sp. 2_MG-2023 TaxID=3062666 RepID=UPI001C0864D1|nr:IS66 family transposase [Gilvimarinus sp. 2_MG-2023]MBU2885501.1 IS66 family transposase [Gilvimarinus agarilyticus]MDO6570401.1 IS66 family transposase [Gilvimarinus sp. 2_MG-2023]